MAGVTQEIANRKNEPRITNYRIEKITNGYILHVTHGAESVGQKLAFLDKVLLLDYLEGAL